MAGDGHHCHRGVDDWIAKEVQAELGLLAVPLEQRSLDYLGSRRWRVRTDCSSIRVGGPEHPRCNKEQTRIRELIATCSALHSFLPADSVTLLTAITRDYISIANPALNSSARPHCGIPRPLPVALATISPAEGGETSMAKKKDTPLPIQLAIQ